MISPSTDTSMPERRKCEKTKDNDPDANLESMLIIILCILWHHNDFLKFTNFSYIDHSIQL